MADDAAAIYLPHQQQQPTAQLASMHWLPFGIAMDGLAPSSAEFFAPRPLQQQQEPASASTAVAAAAGPQQQTYAAAFRGRQLRGVCRGALAAERALHPAADARTPPAAPAVVAAPGAQRELPDGYRGLLLRPLGGACADTTQRSWAAAASFGCLTLWNHDSAPASSDWHNRCLDWLVLADKVRGACGL